MAQESLISHRGKKECFVDVSPQATVLDMLHLAQWAYV